MSKTTPATLLLMALLVGCGGDDTPSPDETGADATLSDCAEEILASDDTAYATCFEGEKVYGPCSTCGYWDDATDAGGPEDCVTCPDGYEIDVVFDDCSGSCVPEGTAVVPLASSDCVAPDAPDEVHETCFSGTITATGCETCGFYDAPEDALGLSDCVTCPEGTEIDVVFGDCTGYCVPSGTALNPIATADCEPDYACVRD